MNKSRYEQILEQFRKEGAKTLKLWADYEALRQKYWQAFQHLSGGPKAVDRFNKICETMQKIQAKIELLWKPHRRVVGTCKKCGGTRMPAVKGRKNGLGCFNSECYHFELVEKKAS